MSDWGTIEDLTPEPTQEPEEVFVNYLSADCPNCDRTRLQLFVRKRRFHSIVCEKCEQKVLAGDFKW